MKIQITSYIHGLSNDVRLDLTQKTINSSNADLILFSGHTVGFVNDIQKLQSAIKNNQTEVVFELQNINSEKIYNCLYHIKKGKIKNLYTNQIFSQSGEIEYNYELGDRLLHEFENNRKIKIKGYSILIIQCGEINILKNIQSDENRVEFRLLDNPSLNDRFTKIIKGTDIFLNPIHSPMGNQGKILKRREFFSNDNKYYFSASNTKEDSINLELKSMQYAYYNKNELIEADKIITDKLISRIFEI